MEELAARLQKRYEWLQLLGKTERDILTDETGDEYICLKTEDRRCTEAKYLPDGLQGLYTVRPLPPPLSGGVGTA